MKTNHIENILKILKFVRRDTFPAIANCKFLKGKKECVFYAIDIKYPMVHSILLFLPK